MLSPPWEFSYGHPWLQQFSAWYNLCWYLISISDACGKIRESIIIDDSTLHRIITKFCCNDSERFTPIENRNIYDINYKDSNKCTDVC
jgi:hypothetical protein